MEDPPCSPRSSRACEPLSEPPERLQVAWISPLRATVGGGAWMEVVRVSDLRSWVRTHGADTTRLLEGLGMVPRGGNRRAEGPWKITIFDVERDWLCRPVEDAEPGEDRYGVAACEAGEQRPLRGHKKGWTGCGYTLDVADATRGLDVYRVQWEVASAWGFCVMPLERFLGGA